MKTLSTIILLLIVSTCLFGQDRRSFLVRYHYETDNNEILLDNEKNHGTSDMTYTNVFFSYLRNPKTLNQVSHENLMLIKVNYEYLIQASPKSLDTTIKIKLNSKDEKIIKKTVGMLLTKSNGKVKFKRLKNKSYEINQSDSSVSININSTTLKTKAEGKLKIFLRTESLDLSTIQLSPLNLMGIEKNFISINMPEVFNYAVGEASVNFTIAKNSQMVLKSITPWDDTRFIEDYVVGSNTYIWDMSGTPKTLTFTLVDMNLDEQIGINMSSVYLD